MKKFSLLLALFTSLATANVYADIKMQVINMPTSMSPGGLPSPLLGIQPDGVSFDSQHTATTDANLQAYVPSQTGNNVMSLAGNGHTTDIYLHNTSTLPNGMSTTQTLSKVCVVYVYGNQCTTATGYCSVTQQSDGWVNLFLADSSGNPLPYQTSRSNCSSSNSSGNIPAGISQIKK